MILTDKTLNRLTISRHDFEKCRDFLLELSAHEYGSIVYESLLLSAIVFYARPFSGNERGNLSKAESKVVADVLNTLTAAERSLHDQIIQLRNKAVAHAEWQYHPTNVTKGKVIKSMPFSIWKYLKSKADMDQFLSLAKKVLLQANHITAEEMRNRPYPLKLSREKHAPQLSGTLV
jgi:hypothetical protein